MKIEFRKVKLSDAKAFHNLFERCQFPYFPGSKTIEEQIKFLKESKQLWKDGKEFRYAIYQGSNLIGGCGIRIAESRNYIAEAGYFVDQAHWGKGIAGKAVKFMEKIAKEKGVHRLQLSIDKRNKASIRVAEKSGYKKEGIMQKALRFQDTYADAYLYARIIKKV